MMQLRVVEAGAYNRYAAIHNTHKDGALACRAQGRSAWLTIHVKRGSCSTILGYSGYGSKWISYDPMLKV